MINRQKKEPMRMCLACREMKKKCELIRIAKNKKNEISVDIKGNLPGRGAYICKNIGCVSKAKREKKLERNLKKMVDENIYDLIKMQLGDRDGL